MNTLWLYDCNDPKLKEKLQGMDFDKAIIDERIRRKTDIKETVLTRCRKTVCTKCNGTGVQSDHHGGVEYCSKCDGAGIQN